MNSPAHYTGGARYELPAILLHDMRTQLNHILGISDLLLEEAHDVGQTNFVADLSRIRGAGQQLLAHVDTNFHPRGTLPESQHSPSMVVAGKLTPVSDDPMTAPGSLLVVDDIDTNREILTRMLKLQGYTVATAQNGREALDMMRAGPFDLVLLDIMMPEMDGYEVLERMQESPQLRALPVIMISALSEIDAVVRCIELGAADYLPKPFNSTLLKARIGACLEKKRAHDREAALFAQLEENFRRLQDLEGQRDDLTNMLVHDLRNPLTSVMAGLQSLEMFGALNANQQEMVSLAVGGGEALLNLIGDLLDVAKMASGAMQLEREALVVADVVSTAIDSMASLAEGVNVSLSSQVAADLPLLLADGGKLNRVLANLLGNAIKFTSRRGSVVVNAHLRDDRQAVVFGVYDTGAGIPPEVFELIFEKFGQAEQQPSGLGRNTGLGLTFCKLAVEAHGGTIWVESVVGEGSAFCFSIPLEMTETEG